MPDFVPGSGMNNMGAAVVYQDNGLEKMKFANFLQQQNTAEQQRVTNERKAEEAHKFALQKYYGAAFDPNKFDTKTDLNKSIQESLLTGKKQLVDIMNKPGISDTAIEAARDQALEPAMKLYQYGASLKRNIDMQMEPLKGEKGLDAGTVQKQAYINAMYTKDKDGKMRLKNAEELEQIDPEHNYVMDLITNHPELVSKGDVDVDSMLKGLTQSKQDLSGSFYSSPGVKKTSDFSASWYDAFQDYGQDEKGVYGVKTKNEPIEVKGQDGKTETINQVPDNVLGRFQSSLSDMAKLNTMTLKYLAKEYPDASVRPGSEGFEVAKKKMLYDMLDERSARSISEKRSENRSGLRVRLDLGGSLSSSKGGGDATADSGEMTASFDDVNAGTFRSSNGILGKIVNGEYVPVEDTFKQGYAPKYKGGEMVGTIALSDITGELRDAVAKYSPGNDITGEKKQKWGKSVPTGMVKIQIKDGKMSAVMTDAGQWFGEDRRKVTNIETKNKTTGMENKEKIPTNTGSGAKKEKSIAERMKEAAGKK